MFRQETKKTYLLLTTGVGPAEQVHAKNYTVISDIFQSGHLVFLHKLSIYNFPAVAIVLPID
jgi:hypothetical protein